MAILLNYDGDTGIWGFVFFPKLKGTSVPFIFEQLNGVRGSLWPKHGVMLPSPHADVEQVHVECNLAFAPVEVMPYLFLL